MAEYFCNQRYAKQTPDTKSHCISVAYICFFIFLADNAYIIRKFDAASQSYPMDCICLSDGLLTSRSPLNNPRHRPAVIASDDSIRVFGGSHNDQFLSSCEQYDTITNKYANHHLLHSSRVHLSHLNSLCMILSN